MVNSTTAIIALLFIFTLSISAGASRACCWDMDMDKGEQHSKMTDSDHKPCHTTSEKTKTESDTKSEESTNCCYDMIECQIQLNKITKSESINPATFVLLHYSLTDNFNSNTVEPLKHPPKVLL